jgi:hypothetical protein
MSTTSFLCLSFGVLQTTSGSVELLLQDVDLLRRARLDVLGLSHGLSVVCVRLLERLDVSLERLDRLLSERELLSRSFQLTLDIGDDLLMVVSGLFGLLKLGLELDGLLAEGGKLSVGIGQLG